MQNLLPINFSANVSEENIIALFKQFLEDEFEKHNLYDFDKLKSIFPQVYPELKIQKNFWLQIKNWHETIVNQNFLAPLFQQDFEEIIFHGAKNVSLHSYANKSFFQLKSIQDSDLLLSFRIMALQAGVEWNFTTPFQSFTYKLFNENCRITLLHPCLSPKGEMRCLIRKNLSLHLELEQFLSAEDQTLVKSLQQIVTNKENLLVAGATGSGKTTFVKSLISIIPKDEHVVILEDTHEIITDHFNHTHLLSDERSGNKRLIDFCAYALRLRPDRILLGEIRKDEVIPFLLSMNTGHKGMLSTVHANSSLDAIHRLALLFILYHNGGTLNFETVLKMIAQSLDYVVFIKEKKIDEIIKIQNAEGTQIFYQTIFKKP